MSKYVTAAVRALNAYTPGEQPKAADLNKLNTNENPYPPSAAVAEVLRSFDSSLLRLYPDPLCNAVRERIAAMHQCTVEQVFVGNGSDEILALCTRAFVEDDGSIGYFTPSYSLYPVLTDIRKARRNPVPLNTGFSWNMPADYRASLFFITNPNAPTSLLFDHNTVGNFCHDFDGVVVIDEAYVDFATTNCMDLALRSGNANTLVMRTLSKSFSLAGLRFGYVIGPVPLISALYKIKDSYNLDMLAQKIALAALNDVDHMHNNVAKIKATRANLTTELRNRGWEVLDSQSNFVFAKPPQGMAAADIFTALRQRHIFVRYFPGPDTADYLRITIGTDQQITALLAALPT